MSKFLLYLDEDNNSHALVLALHRAGIEVRRSTSEAMDGRDDPAQLAFAASQGWALYTSNSRDFNRLHREYLEAGLEHSGIIMRYERRFSIGEQARRIVRIWEALSAEEMVNRVESVSQWGEERA